MIVLYVIIALAGQNHAPARQTSGATVLSIRRRIRSQYHQRQDPAQRAAQPSRACRHWTKARLRCRHLRRVQPPWSVNALAQAAGVAALDDPAFAGILGNSTPSVVAVTTQAALAGILSAQAPGAETCITLQP